MVDASGVYSFSTDTVRRYDLEGTPVWSQEQPRGETVAWLAGSVLPILTIGGSQIASPASVRIWIK